MSLDNLIICFSQATSRNRHLTNLSQHAQMHAYKKLQVVIMMLAGVNDMFIMNIQFENCSNKLCNRIRYFQNTSFKTNEYICPYIHFIGYHFFIFFQEKTQKYLTMIWFNNSCIYFLIISTCIIGFSYPCRPFNRSLRCYPEIKRKQFRLLM